jgi:hypothetical protein
MDAGGFSNDAAASRNRAAQARILPCRVSPSSPVPWPLLAGGPGAGAGAVSAHAPPDSLLDPRAGDGLPAELWRGAPIETVRTGAAPVLAARPLSPPSAQLARRVLATGGAGPEGAVGDEALAGLRASALIALGDPGGGGEVS